MAKDRFTDRFRKKECTECHGDLKSRVPSRDAHRPFKDEDCESCHAARSVSTVYHLGCNDCHLQVSPGIFAGEGENARCERCHLR